MKHVVTTAVRTSMHPLARRLPPNPTFLLPRTWVGISTTGRGGQFSRSLTSSTLRSQQAEQPTPDNGLAKKDNSEAAQSKRQAELSGPRPHLQDEARAEKKQGSHPTTTSPSSNQPPNSSAGQAEARNSLDELLRGLNLTGGARDRPFASPYGSPQRQRVDTSRMAFPESPYRDEFDYFAPFPQAGQAVDTAAPPFRLGPRMGRTVKVEPAQRMDLGRAFRSLDMKCGANQVRHEANMQRFHERPGVKRKRLRSFRWRNRFKVAFQATVRRVEEMRRKGW